MPTLLDDWGHKIVPFDFTGGAGLKCGDRPRPLRPQRPPNKPSASTATALKPQVLAVQGNAEANKGAEAVWHEYYQREGAALLNDPKSPP